MLQCQKTVHALNFLQNIDISHQMAESKYSFRHNMMALLSYFSHAISWKEIKKKNISTILCKKL
jgi:hypothetical protein